jgi:hypothetical protein
LLKLGNNRQASNSGSSAVKDLEEEKAPESNLKDELKATSKSKFELIDDNL